MISPKPAKNMIWFGLWGGYHLRYPMLAMDIITQKVKKMMVFQMLSLPGKEEMEIPEDVDFNRREIMKKQCPAEHVFYRE